MSRWKKKLIQICYEIELVNKWTQVRINSSCLSNYCGHVYSDWEKWLREMHALNADPGNCGGE